MDKVCVMRVFCSSLQLFRWDLLATFKLQRYVIRVKLTSLDLFSANAGLPQRRVKKTVFLSRMGNTLLRKWTSNCVGFNLFCLY